MGYNEAKMRAIERKRTYDSDKDLPEEKQKEIKDKLNTFDEVGADDVRRTAWKEAGPFPKLSRFVKDKFSGDVHEKTPEQEALLDKELERRKRLYGKS